MSMTSNNQLIVMADDDADDRLLVADALRDAAFNGELQFVEDGEELVDYLQQRGKFPARAAASLPGLILLDLNMPKKNGKEVLREIKKDPALRHIPVVVFTTSRADMDIAAAYELGANSFVPKPSAYDALVETMRAIQRYWFGVVELPAPQART